MIFEYFKDVRKLWEATFDTLDDAISIQDKDGTLLKVNKAYAKLLGKTKEELVGSYCYKVVHNQDSLGCKGCPHLKTLKTKKLEHAKYHEKLFNLDLEIITSPLLDDNNEIVGTVHIMRDITEQLKDEEKKVDHEKLLSIIEIAGATCHEINQPLQAILGYADLLEGKLQKNTKEYTYISKIIQSTKDLANITNNLNHITKYKVKKYMGTNNNIIDIAKSAEEPNTNE